MSDEASAEAGRLSNVATFAAFADIVRRCETDGAALCVRGGGTLQSGTVNGGETLDIRALSQPIAHAREDMTITVQAGMTVAALRALLASSGQELPLDVPFIERTTIGGLIATNLSGPRRFSRGGVRDLLLGITIVGRHGEVFRGGGRVVKNVAGYDLCKLYTGSWGWLGAIVEATFRVAPRPESSAAVALALSDPSSAESQLAAVLRGPLRPASIDLLNRAAAGQYSLPDAALTLLVGFEGMREEVTAQVAEFSTEIGDAACERVVLDAASYEAYSRTSMEMVMRPACAARFSVCGGSVAALVTGMSERSPEVPVIAHAADGQVWAGFEGVHDAELNAACDEVAARDGSWLLPRGHGGPVSGCAMFGPPRLDWGLMRRVKAALDPANIFGRGGPFDRTLTSRGA